VSDEVRCVVFDVDDTLYLERDYVRSGIHAVSEWLAARMPASEFERRAWNMFIGGVRHTLFDQALEACGLPVERQLIEQMVEIYRLHSPSIRPTADAERCLDTLQAAVSLAIVTDGFAAGQRAKVKALGIENRMAAIVYTDDFENGFGKPDPRGFRAVEDVIGVTGSACVYIGDNPIKDFAGPRALGWRTVRIRRLDGLHADVEGGDADVELPDLEGLPGVLQVVRRPSASAVSAGDTIA